MKQNYKINVDFNNDDEKFGWNVMQQVTKDRCVNVEYGTCDTPNKAWEEALDYYNSCFN